MNDDECVPGRLRSGMCERHYRRHLKHGSTSSRRVDNLHHYVVDASGCWIWQGALWGNGYGKPTTVIHGTRLAHRMMYIERRGEIPAGLDLDHLCRVRACCNPEHLEPVSRSINLVRGHDARGLCENGLHDLSAPDAVKAGTRECVECWRIRYRAAAKRYRAKKRDAQARV